MARSSYASPPPFRCAPPRSRSHWIGRTTRSSGCGAGDCAAPPCCSLTPRPDGVELQGRRAALAGGLVGALVAARPARNGFVQDDHWVVEQRPLLRHPGSLAAVLTEPYWPRGCGGVLWRPAGLASYALDFRISANPHWFHAVNVLWAAAAAAALALLATLIAGPTVGLVTGLLFAVHPVHVEATASVVGRAELEAAVGYALALISALRSEQRPAWLVGVALGAALAIGAKEHAATLPAAVLLVFLARDLGRAGWRRSLTAAAPAAACATVIVMLYFVARRAVAGGAFTPGGLAPGLRGLDLVDRGGGMRAISLEWRRWARACRGPGGRKPGCWRSRSGSGPCAAARALRCGATTRASSPHSSATRRAPSGRFGSEDWRPFDKVSPPGANGCSKPPSSRRPRWRGRGTTWRGPMWRRGCGRPRCSS